MQHGADHGAAQSLHAGLILGVTSASKRAPVCQELALTLAQSTRCGAGLGFGVQRLSFLSVSRARRVDASAGFC